MRAELCTPNIPPATGPYAGATRLDPDTPPMLSAHNRRRCGPIIVALRPRELPLTPGTKRQAQTHGPPVIRREIPKSADFRPFECDLELTKITEMRT